MWPPPGHASTGEGEFHGILLSRKRHGYRVIIPMLNGSHAILARLRHQATRDAECSHQRRLKMFSASPATEGLLHHGFSLKGHRVSAADLHIITGRIHIVDPDIAHVPARLTGHHTPEFCTNCATSAVGTVMVISICPPGRSIIPEVRSTISGISTVLSAGVPSKVRPEQSLSI